MSRGKLLRFAQLMALPNVYENRNAEDPRITRDGEYFDTLRGNWCAQHFQNTQPLTLELACGRGEYSVALGRAMPTRNFIGVDIKGARIHQGANIAVREGLTNVAFLRTRIEQIELFFAAEEVDEIWITFPDPFLRESKENRRLTSPPFLARYRKFLKKGGIIHLKTDDATLYQFTLDTIAADAACRLHYTSADIYALPELPVAALAFQTYYERKHLADARTIKYVQFSI
jgi:tRNA (guanine-N7-)-methyltransferase